MESISSRPTPGQAKIVSVRTAPPSREPTWSPITVMIGSSALRSACRKMTDPEPSPIARAVRRRAAEPLRDARVGVRRAAEDEGEESAQEVEVLNRQRLVEAHLPADPVDVTWRRQHTGDDAGGIAGQKPGHDEDDCGDAPKG